VVFIAADNTPALQFRMDALVDLGAGEIVGRYDQRALRRVGILFRNRRNALVMVGNLMDAALPVKIPDALCTSPRASCSTTRFSSGSFWRTTSSSLTVTMPAS
jgi:hypothetical protein